ncbi:MAG: phosphomannomutase [Halobacteriaceae archaeon]
MDAEDAPDDDTDRTATADALFGTAGVRGPATEVTPRLALAVGRAVAAGTGTVVVGRDGRVTGGALADAVAAGARAGGAAVVRLGRVPTPALAFASRDRHGVMVTASHNPPADNGLKLFADGREYDAAAERRIADRVAAEPGPVEWDAWGDAREAAVLGDYRDAVTAYAGGHGAPLDGRAVVVDAGNGVAGRATPQVLRELGANVTALHANVDGHFPGRPSKPTPETLAATRRFVASSGAALGLAHDGDGDRIVVLDGAGEVVHEDTVLAILAAHYVRESAAADPVVVTTPNASGRVDELVESAGGRIERVALGSLHEGVAASDGTVVFAAEPWKHLHTAFGGWIDGVVSAAVVARLVAADGLDALREPVTERPYRKEDVACPDDRKAAAMARVEAALPERFPEADVETTAGVRLAFPDGSWVLVRPSGTEPYLRVYVESDAVDRLVAAAVETVEESVAGAA